MNPADATDQAITKGSQAIWEALWDLGDSAEYPLLAAEITRLVTVAHAAMQPVIRSQILATLEWPDSLLCNCPRADNPPTNPRTGQAMDHHCDCAAVYAAAILLGSYEATVHAQQCAATEGPPIKEQR